MDRSHFDHTGQARSRAADAAGQDSQLATPSAQLGGARVAADDATGKPEYRVVHQHVTATQASTPNKSP